jgi:ribosomal-protein-alanine acetyltransferase
VHPLPFTIYHLHFAFSFHLSHFILYTQPASAVRFQYCAMRTRPCSVDDLAQIHALQLSCPQAAHWRWEDYVQLFNDPLGIILVAEDDVATLSQIAGFAAFHRVMDEAELRNMAVAPAHQRRGIARALLAAGILALQATGVSKLFLEVRASNHAAIALYTSAGFNRLHTRRDYYHNPEEDALVMACNISPPPDPSSDKE